MAPFSFVPHGRHGFHVDVLTDLRYSARSLTRTPGLTLPLLLTIALGIGSNAAVFGLIRGLITPDLPLPGIDTIVSLYTRDTDDAFTGLSFDDYVSIRTQNSAFESLGAAQESRPAQGNCRVGVVNEQAAELYFGGRAVGGAVIDSIGRRTEVIGVIQSSTLRASQRRIEPAIYLPMTQDFVPRMTLIAGARAATPAVLGAIAQQVESISGMPRPPVVMTLEET